MHTSINLLVVIDNQVDLGLFDFADFEIATACIAAAPGGR